MTMFDPEFFPTPSALAWKICQPYLAAIEAGTIKSVCDPSAGKGDLLRPFVGKHATLYAIERAPELRAILAAANDKEEHWRRDKPKPHFKVIGDDVFEYSGRHRFDLIVMNPPFSNGDDHLRRAIELLAPSGHLACILNAETVRRPNRLQAVVVDALKAMGATFEYVSDAFKQAERKTAVEVVIIRLQRAARDVTAFDFTGAKIEKTRSYIDDLSPSDIEGQIAKQDTIGNMALCFDNAALALEELSNCWKRAEFYLNGLGIPLEKVAPIETRSPCHPSNVNSMIDAVTEEAWVKVIDRCKLSHLFTQRMQTDFGTFMQAQGSLDFNPTNIRALLRTLMASRSQISEQCILDVFDKMCSYDKANKIHHEGWKTNSAHKVNKKVILPCFISFSWGFNLRYGSERGELGDIDKALCHVTGKPYESIATVAQTLDDAFRKRDGETTAESEFFRLRWFKKGTLHLVFRDPKTWELFNLAAAKGRGWLGKAA